MKERPILFSAPMVRALLAGHKTQTRRIVKPQPESSLDGREPSAPWLGDDRLWRWMHGDVCRDDTARRCPYGVPGDRLWVRESFCPGYFDGGRPAYRADWTERSAEMVPEPRWTPSIHMPRRLSRLTLAVESVRVERVQDITEEDARAEGANGGCLNCGRDAPCGCSSPRPDCRESFIWLWCEINGPESWAANSWAWVVTFAVLKGVGR